MSLRYEVTPGAGIVARHADSLVWVSEEITPETWEAIGAVLDLKPGADPSGADLAHQLGSLDEALRADSGMSFAALIIHDGQAQGILRGPVTVRNRDEVAPATGYEQYGITVPFPMSESVYVGTTDATPNPGSVSSLLDLDAGIVPGGGAWAHPVSSGRRHSGATGSHAASQDAHAANQDAQPSGAGATEAGHVDASNTDTVAGVAAPAGDASSRPPSGAAGIAGAGVAGAGAAGVAAGAAVGFGSPDDGPPASSGSEPASSPDSETPPSFTGTAQDAGAEPESTLQYDPFADSPASSAPQTGAHAAPEPADGPQSEGAHAVSEPEPSGLGDGSEPGQPHTGSDGLGWPEPESSGAPRPVSEWLPGTSGPEPAHQAPESPAAPHTVAEDAPSAAPGTGAVPASGGPVTEGGQADVRSDAPLPPVEGSGSGWAAAGAVGFGAAGAGAAHAASGAPAEESNPQGADQSGYAPAPDQQRVDLQNAQPPAQVEPLAPIAPSGPAGARGQNDGVIVFDDGSTFSLDRDYVVGRRPEKDARVQSGQAAALTVVDPDTVLSSAHALLTRRGGQVFLQDLGSLNGSHVAPPGAADWTRLSAHQEVPIVPGTRLLFGWTVATYSGSAPHQQA